MRRRTALRSLGAAVGFGVVGGSPAATAHPGHVSPEATLELSGTREVVPAADGSVAYAAVYNGYAVVDLSNPADPAVLAERRGLAADREDGPIRQVYDVAVDGDTLIVAGPANPTPEGTRGFVVVDVSDPAEPVERAVHETTFPVHNCEIADGIVYLTGNGGVGLAELVAVDPDDGTELSRWSLADADDRWEAVPASICPLHDVTVRDDTAYLAHWDAGTHLVDVSDPTDPVHRSEIIPYEVGALADYPQELWGTEYTTTPGNSHRAAVDDAGDLLAVNHEAWSVETDDGGYVGGPGGIDLYDVADPADPTHLSSIPAPRAAEPTLSGIWTTSHNFGFADDVLYSSWYQAGVKRHDISDPTAPEEVTWWRDHERTRFWTARPVAGSDVFVAGSMGLPEEPGGIWLFPDDVGTGGRQLPAPEWESAERRLPGDDSTATASPATASPATVSTATPKTGGTTETTATDESSGVSGPGFGPVVGAAGVGVSALLARHLHDSTADADRDDR